MGFRGAPSDATLVELNDEDIAAMLRGGESVRSDLSQPPGGVDAPEVLAVVRTILTHLRSAGYAGGSWMIVSDSEVVGLCGFRAPPSPAGVVEIGYGVSQTRRGVGHATAAVAAMIAEARRDRAIRALEAVTAVANLTSQRVLERNGFVSVGTQSDSDDGDCFLWRKLL